MFTYYMCIVMCYVVILYAADRYISMLFIEDKDSEFCIRTLTLTYSVRHTMSSILLCGTTNLLLHVADFLGYAPPPPHTHITLLLAGLFT